MLTTDQWLPIGSVVHVVGHESPVTIMGYMQQDVETDLLWDYFGLDHPTGFVKPGQDMMFDRDSIDAVLYIGYQSIDSEHLFALLKAGEEDYLAAKRDACAEVDGGGGDSSEGQG